MRKNLVVQAGFQDGCAVVMKVVCGGEGGEEMVVKVVVEIGSRKSGGLRSLRAT